MSKYWSIAIVVIIIVCGIPACEYPPAVYMNGVAGGVQFTWTYPNALNTLTITNKNSFAVVVKKISQSTYRGGAFHTTSMRTRTLMIVSLEQGATRTDIIHRKPYTNERVYYTILRDGTTEIGLFLVEE